MLKYSSFEVISAIKSFHKMQKCTDRLIDVEKKCQNGYTHNSIYIFFKVRKEKRKKKVIYTNVLIYWQNLALINLNFAFVTLDHPPLLITF